MSDRTAAATPVTFADVDKILKTIIANWTKGNGGAPDLIGAHEESSFLLDTREHLLAAKARGIQLIQSEVIGQVGKGATANIVVALTVGVKPFPPMPFGGLDSNNNVFLKLDSPEIKTIIAWIEGGCQP